MRRRRRSCSCSRLVGNTGETAVEMYASHILFRLLFFLPQGGVQSCSSPAGFSVTCGGFTQGPWLLIINTQLSGTTHERPTQFLPAAIMGRQTGHSSNMLLIR